MDYLVVIGDIVASKRIQNRARFQELLKGTLRELNLDSHSLASP